MAVGLQIDIVGNVAPFIADLNRAVAAIKQLSAEADAASRASSALSTKQAQQTRAMLKEQQQARNLLAREHKRQTQELQQKQLQEKQRIIGTSPAHAQLRRDLREEHQLQRHALSRRQQLEAQNKAMELRGVRNAKVRADSLAKQRLDDHRNSIQKGLQQAREDKTIAKKNIADAERAQKARGRISDKGGIESVLGIGGGAIGAVVSTGLGIATSALRAFWDGLTMVGSTLLDWSMRGMQAYFDFAKAAVESYAQIEAAQIDFGVLLGSQDAGKKLVVDIQQLAVASALPHTALQRATKTLLGYGVAAENVLPALKLLGTVSMGDADRLTGMALAMGQISAAGQLFGQDLRQLTERGFNPLQEISRTTGEEFLALKGRMREGTLSANEVWKAFQTATEKGGRFFGALEQRRESLKGLWSQITTNVELFMQAMGKLFADKRALRPIAKDIIALTATLPSFVEWMAEGIPSMEPLWTAFVKKVKEVWDNLRGVRQAIIELSEPLRWAIHSITTRLMNLGKGMWSNLVGETETDWRSIYDTVEHYISLIGVTLNNLDLVVPMLWRAFKQSVFELFVNTVPSWAQSGASTTSSIWSTHIGIFESITNGVMDTLNTLAKNQTTLQGIGAGITGIMDKVLDAVYSVPMAIHKMFSFLFGSLDKLRTNLVGLIKGDITFQDLFPAPSGNTLAEWDTYIKDSINKFQQAREERAKEKAEQEKRNRELPEIDRENWKKVNDEIKLMMAERKIIAEDAATMNALGMGLFAGAKPTAPPGLNPPPGKEGGKEFTELKRRDAALFNSAEALSRLEDQAAQRQENLLAEIAKNTGEIARKDAVPAIAPAGL